MNLLSKILITITFLTCAYALYAQDGKSNISIKTNVDSAGLFIDNEFIGIGGNFSVEKEPGIYSVKLIENMSKWDAEIISDTISVVKDQEKILRYNFKSQTVLVSSPDDVRVFANDTLIGFTPLLLETGYQNLKLEKPDYNSLTMNSEEISSHEIPKLKFDGEPTKKQFYGTTLFGALVGTAIALGAATAYYKLEADDLYEEYKLTGDPGLVDNIDHYDGLSAGTFIGMEICVGALIYFFLTE